jgi:hypothetical protein
MRASTIGVFLVPTFGLAVLVVSHLFGNARIDPSAQSSPQVPAADNPLQTPAESPQPQPIPSPTRRASPQRQTPCWRLAGIAPEAVNQRWHIEDNAKGKIGAVCTDPALTPEKKHEKIQEINDQTEHEIAKIIPAKQLEAFKACQAQRDEEKAKNQGAKKQKGLGPCGGVIPAQPGAAQHSNEHRPGNPKKQ